MKVTLCLAIIICLLNCATLVVSQKKGDTPEEETDAPEATDPPEEDADSIVVDDIPMLINGTVEVISEGPDEVLTNVTMDDESPAEDGDEDEDGDDADEADAGEEVSGGDASGEGTCGFGDVGNGVCFDPSLCCSGDGHCTASDDCEAGSSAASSNILAAMIVAAGTQAILLL